MTKVLVTNVRDCRVCLLADSLELVVDLGIQPHANHLLEKREDDFQTFPLSLGRCRDCGAVQLIESLNRNLLFENYVWVTGTARATREFSKEFECLIAEVVGDYGSVMEVASNDGTFLKPFIQKGKSVIGIEPAKNIADIAKGNGVPTVNEFFTLEFAEKYVSQFGCKDLVFARNVLAHVDEIHDFCKALSVVVSESGTVVVEVHYGLTVLDEVQFDSIYHEHIFYLTKADIESILSRYGLEIYHATQGPISGGSLIIFASKNKAGRTASKNAIGLRDLEQKRAITTREPWSHFAQRMNAIIADAISFLSKFDGDIYAFGASARGIIFLQQLYDHGFDRLAAVIDNSDLKVGKVIPKLSVSVISLDSLRFKSDTKPLILITAWNFYDEIIDQLREENVSCVVARAFPRWEAIDVGKV